MKDALVIVKDGTVPRRDGGWADSYVKIGERKVSGKIFYTIWAGRIDLKDDFWYLAKEVFGEENIIQFVEIENREAKK